MREAMDRSWAAFEQSIDDALSAPDATTSFACNTAEPGTRDLVEAGLEELRRSDRWSWRSVRKSRKAPSKPPTPSGTSHGTAKKKAASDRFDMWGTAGSCRVSLQSRERKASAARRCSYAPPNLVLRSTQHRR